jgi:hypothetical protein
MNRLTSYYAILAAPSLAIILLPIPIIQATAITPQLSRSLR